MGSSFSGRCVPAFSVTERVPEPRALMTAHMSAKSACQCALCLYFPLGVQSDSNIAISPSLSSYLMEKKMISYVRNGLNRESILIGDVNQWFPQVGGRLWLKKNK